MLFFYCWRASIFGISIQDILMYIVLSYEMMGKKKVALYAAEKSKLYDEIILPAEGAMSWYYLFYTQNFSPNYIGKFKLDARIDQTQKIGYIENSCPTNALNNEKIKKNVLIIDRFNCESNKVFKQIDSITDVNPLMTYKVFVP